MAKKYRHLRIEEIAYSELRKMKNFYELQDNKEYTFSDIVLKLIDDRAIKQFKLPLTDKRHEL